MEFHFCDFWCATFALRTQLVVALGRVQAVRAEPLLADEGGLVCMYICVYVYI